jgi:LacI family transcriptional regulator
MKRNQRQQEIFGAPGKTVSQMDVARAMGVSIATISRVLSGKADMVRCVAPETVKKVRDTAARLGYRMNFAGRMLRTRRANAVGLLFSSMSPFYLEIVPELQRCLFARGYAALCGFWTAEQDAEPTISAIVERDVDGIITCHWPDVMRRLAGDIPTVFYLGHDPTLDCVNCDYSLDAAFAHLAGLGHRRVLLCGVSPPDVASFPGLTIEYADLRHGLRAERHDGLDEIAQRFFARRAASTRPTAAICVGDYTAATLAALLARCGIRVPEDVSIIATGTSRAYETAVPPVTTFGVGAGTLAQALVDALFFRLENPDAPPQQIVLGRELTMRGSTAARADYPVTGRPARGIRAKA